jgi:hypothetical protein
MEKLINEFVSYDIALAMKELGFDELCLVCYYQDKLRLTTDEEPLVYELEDNSWRRNSDFNNSVTAPLYQQAFRWFRENYNFKHTINWDYDEYTFDAFLVDSDKLFVSKENYSTYEEAEQACLRKMVEMIKEIKEY